jgi:hypothetical protein
MARIVLGLGSSHSPHVSTAPDLWHLHAERDRNNPHLDFAALTRTAPADIAEHLTADVYQRKHEACQAAIARLADALEAARVDAVVVIGDDQRELFKDECSPAFAVYTGSDLVDIPPEPETVHPSHKPALWSRHSDVLERYLTRPDFARHLAASLSGQEFDVATCAAQYAGRSLGHAYTFVRLRLMRDMVPMVPVFVNCYYPPNQPSPERCFRFGQALRRAIDAWPGDLRVALVASGGLSHFVIDETMDRQVLRGIAEHRRELLTGLPTEKLNSGNSEIRNWIVMAGALEDYDAAILDYTPSYRTEAGTGCGMAFVRWDPAR